MAKQGILTTEHSTTLLAAGALAYLGQGSTASVSDLGEVVQQFAGMDHWAMVCITVMVVSYGWVRYFTKRGEAGSPVPGPTPHKLD